MRLEVYVEIFGTSRIYSMSDADTSWFLKINSHV